MHQRLIYHRSKGRFTPAAGAQFKTQCDIWLQSCERALNSSKGGKVRRPESAWAKLQDVSILLSIGEENIGSVVDAVFDGNGEADFAKMGEMLGLNGSLSREETQDVLRVRTDVRW